MNDFQHCAVNSGTVLRPTNGKPYRAEFLLGQVNHNTKNGMECSPRRILGPCLIGKKT